MKSALKITLILLLFISFLSCAESMQPAECIVEENDGFWNGLIHGIIAPFTFIVSLFDDQVAVYSLCNNGGWYDFGFLFGASIIFGAGGRGSK